ncbi:hypothetical protein MTO96_025622 [Rhipicephalus appendiculatus]
MRALVDVSVEKELRIVMQKARSLEPPPPGFPSDHGTFAAVFCDLRAAVGTGGMRDGRLCTSCNDVWCWAMPFPWSKRCTTGQPLTRSNCRFKQCGFWLTWYSCCDKSAARLALWRAELFSAPR